MRLLGKQGLGFRPSLACLFCMGPNYSNSMVRVEEELKHQRELLKTFMQQMDKRFEAMQQNMDKRFLMLQWFIATGIGLVIGILGLLKLM